MDINEIFFSNLKKFDGKTRRLNLIEMSQIAGRAGRFKNDGGFKQWGLRNFKFGWNWKDWKTSIARY